MFLCRDIIGSSLAEIGNRLGNRHHSTVMHSIDYIENKIKDGDAETLKNIDILRKKLDPQ